MTSRGGRLFDQVARQLLLQLTDELWRDHLLGSTASARGLAFAVMVSATLVLEYKKEAFSMFLRMSALRDDRLLAQLNKVQAIVPQVQQRPMQVLEAPMEGGEVEQAPPMEEPPLALPEPPPMRRPEKGKKLGCSGSSTGCGGTTRARAAAARSSRSAAAASRAKTPRSERRLPGASRCWTVPRSWGHHG